MEQALKRLQQQQQDMRDAIAELTLHASHQHRALARAEQDRDEYMARCATLAAAAKPQRPRGAKVTRAALAAAEAELAATRQELADARRLVRYYFEREMAAGRAATAAAVAAAAASAAEGGGAETTDPYYYSAMAPVAGHSPLAAASHHPQPH